jgi:hypothetical protein
MLSLPSKPWKKVKIEGKKEGKYLLTFLTPIKESAEFERIIEEDLKYCLGEKDRFGPPKWKTKSIPLFTPDIQSFRRRLLYQRIFIEDDEETGARREKKSRCKISDGLNGLWRSSWRGIFKRR